MWVDVINKFYLEERMQEQLEYDISQGTKVPLGVEPNC